MLRLVLIFGVLFVAGCRETLYSDLGEIEANEMLAVLQAADIHASRQVDSDGRYTLKVDNTYVGAAILILQQEGLPRQKFKSLGDIFADSGLVGTPFEERARFMHALNQELSATISTIEGIKEARVHVVLPETGRFDREARQATAAVAVYHTSDFERGAIVPEIKMLLSHSVPNLTYEGVSVSLFGASGAQIEVNPRQTPGIANASPLGAMNLKPNLSMGENALGIGLMALLLTLGVTAVVALGHFVRRAVARATNKVRP